MKQIQGLWRDTWWLWMIFVLLTIILAALIGKFFLLLLPCFPVPFIYFAFVRYDEEGKEKADLGS